MMLERSNQERAHMETSTTNDLGLARQTSESELQRILGLALNVIDHEEHQKPSAPAAARPTRGPIARPSVTQMLAMVAKLSHTAQSVNQILVSRILSSRLAAWKLQSQQAFWPTTMKRSALEAFEAEDIQCTGVLTPAAANRAYCGWIEILKLHLGTAAETLCPAPLKLTSEAPCDLTQFIQAIGEMDFNDSLRPAVDKFSSGVQCVCGAWMVQRDRAACYPGGGVTCDFTGDTVSGDTVWHCERNRSEGAHPFGFDIAEESVHKFVKFQVDGRLYDRLQAAEEHLSQELEGASAEEPASQPSSVKGLTRRRTQGLSYSPHKDECQLEARKLSVALRKAECVTDLLPHAMSMFLTIKDYLIMLTNAGAKEEALAPLKRRLEWSKAILRHDDWVTKKANAVKQVESTLQSLEQLTADLAHDQLKFKDVEHRTAEIARFEAQFNPASRHAEFEKSTAIFKQLSSVTRDIVGFEACDMDDPEVQQLMSVFGEQILQHLMSQRALPSQFTIVSVEHEQNEQGVLFKWKVAVPGREISCAHQVGLDSSDVEHAQMHRRFMGLYHGIQERIKALEHCATEGDLLSQLCEFQIDKKHEGEMCVMCQEEMCCGEQALKVNTCGHVFHDECVRPWFLGCKHECPVCKAPVVTGSDQPKEVEARVPEGASVVVGGLVSRADLNGTIGVITRFNQQSGRYEVQTEAGNLSVRRRNLTQCESLPEEDTEEAEASLEDQELRAAMEFDDEPFDEELYQELRSAMELSREQ